MKLQIELVGLFFLVFCFSFYWYRFVHLSKVEVNSGGRSAVIDFVRGLAMIGIVSIHIDSYFSFFHPEDSFLLFTKSISNLSRFSVPAFIFSSALFLKWKGRKEYWDSKWKGLLIPFLLFSVLGYFTKYQIFQDGLDGFLYRLVWGKVFEPYYYVPLLFQFYLLYAIFFKNQENISNRRKLLYILISAIINFLSNQYFPANTEILRNIENISFTNFIFFFTIGFYSKEIFRSTNSFLQFWKFSVPILFYISTIIFIGYIFYVTFQFGYLFSNHFLFYPFTMFSILYFVGYKIESGSVYPKLYNSICYIGQKSLAVFLIHPIVIHLMHLFDPYYMFGNYTSYLLTLVLNIGLPLVVWKYYELIQEKVAGLAK